MHFRRIHHVAIICSNYHRSKDFYVNIIGLTVVTETYREERDSYKLDLAVNGQYQIELFSFPTSPARLTQPEALGLRHLAFEVADISAAVEELKGKGVVCEEVRTDEVAGKKFTFFRDPDQLPIELYEA